MHMLEIGDLMLEDVGPRVRLTIAEQRDTATWSVDGASLAVGWLLAWIAHQPGQSLDSVVPDALLNKTVGELLTEGLSR